MLAVRMFVDCSVAQAAAIATHRNQRYQVEMFQEFFQLHLWHLQIGATLCQPHVHSQIVRWNLQISTKNERTLRQSTSYLRSEPIKSAVYPTRSRQPEGPKKSSQRGKSRDHRSLPKSHVAHVASFADTSRPLKGHADPGGTVMWPTSDLECQKSPALAPCRSGQGAVSGIKAGMCSSPMDAHGPI